MNTRSYPRTAADAFKGCDYACAIERPPRRAGPALAIAAVLLLALLALGMTR